MAVGTVGFPQQLNQGFNPLSPINGVGAATRNRGDGFTGSDALRDPANPLAAAQGMQFANNLGGTMMDGILKSQAVQVIQGLQQGQDVRSAAQSLQTEYQKAKQGNLTLNPQTEELVQQALKMAQEAGQLDPQQGQPQGGTGGTQQGGGNDGGGGSHGGGDAGGANGANGGNRGSGTQRGGTTPRGPSPDASEQPSSTDGNPGPAPANPNAPSNPNTAENQVNQTAPGERVADAAPTTPGESINQFGQTTPDNCSAVAIIKQMRAQWGRDAMQIQRTENGVNVTMRDDYQVQLTREQIRQAREGAAFRGEGRGMNNAVMYMAAAAQRYAQENGVPYAQALQFLNGQNFPQDIARYFGVGTQEVNPRTLQGPDGTQYPSAIAYDNDPGSRADDRNTAHHTAMVVRRPDGSMVYDHYGQQRPYNGRITNAQGVTGDADRAFVLTDVNGGPGGNGTRGWGRRAARGIDDFAPSNSPGSSTSRPTTRPSSSAPSSTGGGATRPKSVSRPSSGGSATKPKSSSGGGSSTSSGGGTTTTTTKKTSTKKS